MESSRKAALPTSDGNSSHLGTHVANSHVALEHFGSAYCCERAERKSEARHLLDMYKVHVVLRALHVGFSAVCCTPIMHDDVTCSAPSSALFCS